jgi:hypothetical protein
MPASDTELPDDRVRHALAQLGADTASAPDVPAAVTARIGAALRAAPPPAHSTVAGRSRLGLLRVIALVIGVGAVIAAVAFIVAATHDASAPRFPTGPTADRITVSRAPTDTPKAVVTPP